LDTPTAQQASAVTGDDTDAEQNSSEPAGTTQGGDESGWEFPAQYDRFGVSRGQEQAPVVVREFGDYQCPACADFYSTIERVVDEYVQSGDVRYVFFDFPLRATHKHALKAAQAARCAGRQGDYWAMHDALYENHRDWTDSEEPLKRFVEYANASALDGSALAECVRKEQTLTAVNRSQELGRQLGVRQTPSVIVGDQAFKGALPFERLRREIEKRLPANDDV
jgi:protein-disulfide isomerase